MPAPWELAVAELRIDQLWWFPAAPWWRPRKVSPVEADGVWYLKTDANRASWRRVVGTPGVVGAFIRLADAGPPQFAAFAMRFGMLMHCRHGKYWLGCPKNRSDKADELFSFCRPTFREPIDEWRTQARRIRAVLTCSGLIWQGENPEETDLADAARIPVKQLDRFIRALYEQTDGKRKVLRGRDVGQLLVENAVNQLLRRAMVAPQFRWSRDSCQMDLGGGGLLGALATEVALAVGKVERLVLCHNCGQPIVGRKRQPAVGRRAWCERPECKRARSAAAARDFRRRKGGDWNSSLREESSRDHR